MSKGKYIKPSCKQHVGAGYYVEKNVAKCNYCSEIIATTNMNYPPQKKTFTPNPNYVIKSGNHAGETILEATRKSMNWALYCISRFQESTFMAESIMMAINIVNQENGNGKSFTG